jgi:hypothetical protein
VTPDALVHLGLGEGWLVALVVAVLPVAEEVDDDVAVEALAVFGGQTHDVHAGLRVVSVDVKDGDVEHLRLTGAVQRAAALVGLGRVADLVVTTTWMVPPVA